jgi:hypothetical protein
VPVRIARVMLSSQRASWVLLSRPDRHVFRSVPAGNQLRFLDPRDASSSMATPGAFNSYRGPILPKHRPVTARRCIPEQGNPIAGFHMPASSTRHRHEAMGHHKPRVSSRANENGRI